ncbi:MAG: ABC transporter ATP-binding protein, partial [Phenylobacterium sp.]
MTDAPFDDAFEDDESDQLSDRAGTLGNLQLLGFIWGHWTAEPRRFALAVAIFLTATICDLAIPWTVKDLMDAVSRSGDARLAWQAWALLSALYAAYYLLRSSGFRLLNGFYARIMERIVTQGFARVQAFSSDWHASNFAGATVRKVSRAMWGYDSASDALLLMLMPTLIVLGGLAVSMGVRWPMVGLFVAVMVAIFAAYNVLMAQHYTQPANQLSNRLDSSLGAALADAIGGNAVVKSFGAEAREEARFGEAAARWRRSMMRTWDRFNLTGVGQNLMLLVLQAGLTGMLLHAWTRGQASPGDVAFAITSFMLMAGYMRNFSEITRMLQKGLDDSLDVALFMKTPP